MIQNSGMAASLPPSAQLEATIFITGQIDLMDELFMSQETGDKKVGNQNERPQFYLLAILYNSRVPVLKKNMRKHTLHTIKRSPNMKKEKKKTDIDH